ncbi:DUF5050 domain-containing protein [Pseudobacteroides cellulosolvens]|uniref:Copper amine oxidase-like domain-containing protein n=1 Tax=Pseudobacteroides cellulosolvens ATCC 35603 = DSM 2933 TaxID=398512 RepID=A0A0L6JGR7_9FIRM|nr:DUF5050 domain-containing protein [Pseudobacteroides cellulosolvens]KNY24895.1 copper amine oxidase-like domain-containing protein [Pseudobacteroides cellulosolvens ATCC 35603 = DSM 2933]
MKKIIIVFAFLLLQSIVSFSSYSAPAKIKVIVRGKALTMDVAPVVSSGRTLIPVRDIFESLDAYVEWNAKTKSITATRCGKVIKLKIGDNAGFINDAKVMLDASPRMINGKAMVPLRFVGEALGSKVEWDNSTSTITISTDSWVEKTYNTTGNIVNGGFVCSSGEYDYISFYNLGTYKIKHGTSEKIKINVNPVSFINVIGDWIYFVNSDKYPVKSERKTLYRMKTDGTSAEKLASDTTSCALIVDDWIYYINNTDSSRPYKIRLDGKGRQKISNYTASNLMVSNGWIYFINDGNICRMRTNGKDYSVLCEESTGYMSFNDDKDKIYFSMDSYSNSGIYVIKTDGTNKNKLISTEVNCINPSDGLLYYNDFEGNLYKTNEDGSGKKKIANQVKGGLNVSGHWIYYTNYILPKSSSDSNIFETPIESISDMDTDIRANLKTKEFRVMTDGSVRQNMDNEGPFLAIPIYMPGTTFTTPKPIAITSTLRPETTLSPKDIAKNTGAIFLIKTFDENGEPIGSGTGFNIESSGIIVTNYHVIKGAFTIKCSIDKTKTYDVDYVLNYNTLRDIAVLKVKNASNLPVLDLGDSDKLELGEEVVAIGNPLQLQNSVTTGIVSGELRTIFGVSYIQTDASISPGNSGGPLINSYGEVIGITTMSISDSQNINFAVPINSVKKLFPTASIIPLSAASSVDEAYEESEPNNTILKANDFFPNTNMIGTFKDAKDLDYFNFTLNTKTKVTIIGLNEISIYTTSTIAALDLSLIDKSGNDIAKSIIKDESEYTTQNITIELNPGDYKVLVKPSAQYKNNSFSDYQLIFVTD